MLNWNAPWPVMNDRSDSAGPTPTANGPWDVAAIFELQTRWWNQFLDASRGFWSLYGWTPPALSLTGDSSPSAETTETIVENVIEQGTPAEPVGDEPVDDADRAVARGKRGQLADRDRAGAQSGASQRQASRGQALAARGQGAQARDEAPRFCLSGNDALAFHPGERLALARALADVGRER